MKIFPISFKKTLKKNSVVYDRKNNSSYSCAIYKLDTPEDKDYFEKTQTDKKWNNNRFISEVDLLAKIKIDDAGGDSYVMEDAKGDCLGYICTSDDHENKIKEIMFLETCPEYAKANQKRGLKYIGETLLSYVVELADKNNFECVSVPIPSKKAEGFYTKKCGFENDPKIPSGKILYRKDFQKLIEQNRMHTTEESGKKNFFQFLIQKKENN